MVIVDEDKIIEHDWLGWIIVLDYEQMETNLPWS